MCLDKLRNKHTVNGRQWRQLKTIDWSGGSDGTMIDSPEQLWSTL
jgi:hypothetical protein